MHLAGWAGVLQADAYGGYGKLYEGERKPAPIIEAACWAHARRKFFELADIEGAARQRVRTKVAVIAPLALEAVRRMDELFAIEREANGIPAGLHARDREPSVAEVHAVDMSDGYLQGLLGRFWTEASAGRVTLLNGKVGARGGTPPALYAHAVVETVKIGLRHFKRDVLRRETIGNVDVILDVNDHNDHADFDAEMRRAQAEDGHFKGVNRVSKVDSASSRLLQLADVVAYSRKWITGAEANADGLLGRYGVRVQ